MSRPLDLAGRTFGDELTSLTVLRQWGLDKQGSRLWLCRCSCPEGTQTTVRGSHLLSGKTRSCGCRCTSEAYRSARKRQCQGFNPRGEPVGTCAGFGRPCATPIYARNASGLCDRCRARKRGAALREKAGAKQ